VNELGFPEPFTGDALELRPSVWISSLDVTAAGGRIEATIRGVYVHPRAVMPDGSVLTNCNALHFTDPNIKPLVLTAKDNIGPLIFAFGRDVREWAGQRVVLINKPTNWGPGVRIRKL
jgi:hypothetical protein